MHSSKTSNFLTKISNKSRISSSSINNPLSSSGDYSSSTILSSEISSSSKCNKNINNKIYLQPQQQQKPKHFHRSRIEVSTKRLMKELSDLMRREIGHSNHRGRGNDKVYGSGFSCVSPREPILNIAFTLSNKKYEEDNKEYLKNDVNININTNNNNNVTSSQQSSSTSITTQSQFTVELANDLLYEWYIKIYQFDNESQVRFYVFIFRLL